MKKGMLFEAVVVVLLILLSFTLYLMVTTGPGSSDSWTISGVTSKSGYSPFSPYYLTGSNMFVGENGILYTVDGRNIHALDKNGNIIWSAAIPDHYNKTIHGMTYDISARGEKDIWIGLDATVANGTLYTLVIPTNPATIQAALLAISPDGTIEWELPFSNSGDGTGNGTYVLGSPQKLTVIDSNIYVDMSVDVAVIATNGTFLWSVGRDMYYRSSSIDPEGNLYTMSADLKPIAEYNSSIYEIQSVQNGTPMGGNCNAITAFYPNGTINGT